VISRPTTALCATGALVALLAPSGGLGAAPNVYRVQLDGDETVEQVRIERRRCKDTAPCTRVAVRDGSRRAALTPISQRPGNRYNWQVSKVQFHDLTADGQPEIVWTLGTVGGTGSSPVRTGVHTWDGKRAKQIFEHDNGKAAEPGYARVTAVRARVLEEEGELPELELRESLDTPKDATCCPSAYRYTRYRWDGAQLALIAGSKRIQKKG